MSIEFYKYVVTVFQNKNFHIKQILNEPGFTKDELRSWLSVTESKFPSVEQLDLMCKYLNCDKSDLADAYAMADPSHASDYLREKTGRKKSSVSQTEPVTKNEKQVKKRNKATASQEQNQKQEPTSENNTSKPEQKPKESISSTIKSTPENTVSVKPPKKEDASEQNTDVKNNITKSDTKTDDAVSMKNLEPKRKDANMDNIQKENTEIQPAEVLTTENAKAADVPAGKPKTKKKAVKTGILSQNSTELLMALYGKKTTDPSLFDKKVTQIVSDINNMSLLIKSLMSDLEAAEETMRSIDKETEDMITLINGSAPEGKAIAKAILEKWQK